MMRVLQPGLYSTVQDLGRQGYTAWGISPSGAADPLTFRAGNLLLGNPESAPAVELTATGGRFVAEADMYVLLAGAATVSRAGAAAAPWKPLRLRAGQELTIGPITQGLRGYLCVAGGFQAPLWLGSASTHVPSGMGGWQGRPLRKDDRLPVGAAAPPRRHSPLSAALRQELQPRALLRLTPGPHVGWLRASVSIDAPSWLESTPWRTLPDSNRMGLRLRHSGGLATLLDTSRIGEVLSVGVPLGAVQLTPSGELALLLVDSQTTGGYPLLASVISADIPATGQLRPGDRVQFRFVALEAARQALLHQEALLQELRV
ncbi:MAG: biotin-dependent carboxyltransferase family protein [Bryobacterales bacterium]|jgi:antagonist of KipI|nr:biotin-dependent carboxyltransferase family protein [Bryobacterales bacterium]